MYDNQSFCCNSIKSLPSDVSEQRGCKTILQAGDPPTSHAVEKYERGLNKQEIISTRYQSGFESRPPANSPHYRQSGKQGRPNCILGQYSGFGIIYIFRHAWLTISLLRTNFGGLQSRWPWRHSRRGNICSETRGSIQMFACSKMAGEADPREGSLISSSESQGKGPIREHGDKIWRNLNINLTATLTARQMLWPDGNTDISQRRSCGVDKNPDNDSS